MIIKKEISLIFANGQVKRVTSQKTHLKYFVFSNFILELSNV